MHIEKISEPTEELYAAMRHLIPQLGIHKIPPTREELTRLLNTAGATLLIARYPDEHSQIVGILSLTVYRVPTGGRSIVEDVVGGEWRVADIQPRAGSGQSVVSVDGV
jgi:hypothetical protein